MAAGMLASTLAGAPGAGFMDPALLQAQPQLSLAQTMMQQGIDTSPAYPMQALARMAQAASGHFLQEGAISDLAKAYSQSASNAAATLPEGPLKQALLSPDPVVRMQALQQYGKVLTLQSEPQKVTPGEEVHPSATAARPAIVSGQPQSQPGRIANDIVRAERTNPAAVTPLGQALGKETVTPEGVPYPAVGVLGQVRTQSIRPPLSTMPQAGPNQPFQGAPPPSAQPSQSGQSSASQVSGMTGQVAQAAALKEGTVQAMKDFNEKSVPAYNSAQNLLGRLDIINHNIDVLGPNWMGAGANIKGEVGKAWNSTLDSLGVKGMHIDPQKIASWEDFNKETIRAGMELIKSNFGGSREAASIIQMGNTAVPNVQNTPLGAKYVSATIRAAAQREIDLHEYKAGLAQVGHSLVGADVFFNKTHPTKDYAMGAITSVIPQPAKAHLLSDPKLAPMFDKQFGPGTAEFILKTAPPLAQVPNG